MSVEGGEEVREEGGEGREVWEGRGRSVHVEEGEVCEGVTVHRGMQTIPLS